MINPFNGHQIQVRFLTNLGTGGYEEKWYVCKHFFKEFLEKKQIGMFEPLKRDLS